jgi:hypothetical protein
MPYRKLETVLTDWRAAERHLAGAELDDDERVRLEGEVERLRQEYQRRLHQRPLDEAGRDVQPDLPPFPAARVSDSS